jgi:hypothetical protein
LTLSPNFARRLQSADRMTAQAQGCGSGVAGDDGHLLVGPGIGTRCSRRDRSGGAEPEGGEPSFLRTDHTLNAAGAGLPIIPLCGNHRIFIAQGFPFSAPTKGATLPSSAARPSCPLPPASLASWCAEREVVALEDHVLDKVGDAIGQASAKSVSTPRRSLGYHGSLERERGVSSGRGSKPFSFCGSARRPTHFRRSAARCSLTSRFPILYRGSLLHHSR